MRWYHVFVLPSYVSKLEKQIEANEKARLETFRHTIRRLDEITKELSFLRDKTKGLDKYFSTAGLANDIEKEDDKWDDVDENYRIPIVDGMRIVEEGQDVNTGVPLKIYTGNDYGSQSGSDQPKTND